MVGLPMYDDVVFDRTPGTRCPVPVVICFFWLVAMAGTSFAFGSDGMEVATLRQIWNAQRNEIQTARIDYRIARRGPSSDKPITVADFRALLGAAEFTFDDGGVDRLVRRLDSDAAPEDPVSVQQRLTIKGDWRRVSSPIKGVEGTQVHTDRADIRLAGNSDQINVYAAGACPVSMTSLGGLRLNPSFLEDDASVVASKNEGDRIEIESPQGNLRMVADLRSGFVHEYAKGTETRSMRLTFQYRPTQYADGIIFPACRVDGTFSRGVLSLFTITLITNAQFNIQVADDEFDVAGRAGAKIIDFREDRHSPKLLILDRPTTSVLSRLIQADPDEVLQIPRSPEVDDL